MKAATSNGGPVYPVRIPIPDATHRIGDPVPTELHTGMSMRDYFAAQAMVAYIAENYASARQDEEAGGVGGVPWENSLIAKFAYDIADAMLIARQS